MKKTVLFLSLLFINGLEAQTLSLNACIQKAFKSHPDIKKSLLQIKHSKYGVDAAKADYRPQLSLDAEYNQ